jgi:autotransporter-associated beta strand protein
MLRTAPPVLLLLLLPGFAAATDYYVSPTGSDSNPGTFAQPFRTIQKAADTVQAGDEAIIRGGTYRETVTLRDSGTSTAPIRFQAYAGESATITGLDVVSGWAQYSGSIYQTSLTNPVSQVFVGGKPMTEARWPNPTYANPLVQTFATVGSASIQAAPSTSTITDSNLASVSGNWTGAQVAVVGGSAWVAYGGSVSSKSGTTLSFQWPGPTTTYYAPKAGNHYYLYGSVAAVDSQKEWYYDSSADKLYFYAPGGGNPNGQTVEARTRNVGFDFGSQSYVQISGLRFQAANVQTAGNYDTIDNCQILYPTAFFTPNGWTSQPGVTIAGQYDEISNSEIAFSWGDGVTLQNSNNTVQNNLIHDVDWSATDGAFVYASNSGTNNITNNTMYNAGRSGVLHRGTTHNLTIAHNDISRYGYLTSDLGGTYTWGSDGAGTVIEYNRIHDKKTSGQGDGIYLDNNHSGTTVDHNLVYNVDTGIRQNQSATNDGIYNNTLWNVTNAMGDYAPTGSTMGGCTTQNNLSNNGTFTGNTKSNNLGTTTNPFVNSAAGDFTLRSGTAPIDYGVVVPGITDGYTGTAPDAGAFEYGVTPWTAGASLHSWLAGNQSAAPLTAALYVTPSGSRVDTGDLVAGNSGSIAGQDNRIFLNFDLSGFGGRRLRTATLRVYQSTGTGEVSGGLNLYPVTSAWTSSTVTYNQSVGAGTALNYDPSNLDFYADVDVTSLAAGWLANVTTNYGISLRGTEGSTQTAKYISNGYDVTPPQLVLTWAGSAYSWTNGSGNGLWDASSTNWSLGAGNVPWANSNNDDAIFGPGETGTVTLGTNVATYSITFSSPGYSLAPSSYALTINAGGVAAAESASINQNVTLSAAQTWSAASGKSLSVGGSVDLGGNVLTIGGGGATSFGGMIGGNGAVVMSGSGTLTLLASNNYSGGTTIASGIVALRGGDNRLPVGTSVQFSGNGTLDVGGNLQTLAMVTVANGVTGIIAGSGGTLQIGSGGDFQLAPDVSGAMRGLNLAGLSNFVYSNSAATFRVDGMSASNAATSGTATLTLSPNSTITAANFFVGQFATSSAASGNVNAIVNLGQNTTINADAMQISYYRDAAALQYGSSIASSLLTLRGTAGSNTRANMVVGAYTPGGTTYAPGTVDLVTNVTGSSLLDAKLGTLTIGVNNRGTNATTAAFAKGVFIMGGGTLDTTTMMIGQITANSTCSTSGCQTSGVFTSGPSAVVKVQDLYLGDTNISSGSTQTVTATFNLFGGADVYAQTIAKGPGAGTVGTFTRGFNWDSGTIHNYDTATDLTIDGNTVWSLSATGAHTFNIDSGRTGTVAAVLSGSGASLVKSGGGTLVLNASNSYTGGTTVSGGALLLSAGTLNSVGQVSLAAGTTFGGNGSAGTATLASGAILQGGFGTSGKLALNGLTFNGSSSIGISGSLAGYASSAAIAVTNVLTTNGTETINILGSLIGASTSTPYHLFTYGSIGGSGTAAFRIGTLPNRGSGVLSFPGNGVDLKITSTDFVFWTGAGTLASEWDINTTPNWALNSSSASTTYFDSPADTVVFDDRAAVGNGTVNLATVVHPIAVSFSNTATSYVLRGAGGIAGGTGLTINGAGSVTIATSNGYTGGTTLGSGLLNLANSSALGSGALTMVGGTLDNSTGSAMTISNAVNVNGSFTFIGSSPLAINNAVALGATTGVNIASGGMLTAQGVISGSNGLTLSGGGTLVVAAANTYVGDTTISRGVLQIAAGGAIPNGAANGNVVFNSTANSAVLDINGNNPTINGLSEPGISSTSLVLNNAPGGLNTITVGNNNASSTFGGMLVDNNNGLGGRLNLWKTGAGALTLIGSNTYTGTTTVNSGTLQLGDGTFGHDGMINQTSGVTNNATLVFNFFAAQTFTGSITGGTVAQSGPGAVTLTGADSVNRLAITNNGAIYGALTVQSTGISPYLALTNTAMGTTTLGASISMTNGREDWTSGSGTLNIAGPITQTSGHFFIDNGNYTMGNSASINMPSGTYALVLAATPSGTTNFVQTGGLIYVNRPTVSGLYMSQAGTGNYTITGGSAVINGRISLSDRNGAFGTMTINGLGALVSAGSLNLNLGAAGNGNATFNMQNGLLQTDDVYTVNATAAPVTFNFSGGTLQPLDSSVISFGSSAATSNVTLSLSGSGATISSTDAVGNAETVPVYAKLAGSGAMYFTGAGTLILSGTNTYSGGTIVNSGTLIVQNSQAIATGTSLIIGNALAFSPAAVVPSPVMSSAAISPVPEPGTWALVASAALAGIGIWRRTERRSRQRGADPSRLHAQQVADEEIRAAAAAIR